MEHIDWTECALIETVPGKRGGKPVIKGTRRRPDDLFVNREQGIEWLAGNHGGITLDTVRAVFDFYDRRFLTTASHAVCGRSLPASKSGMPLRWAGTSCATAISSGLPSGTGSDNHATKAGRMSILGGPSVVVCWMCYVPLRRFE